MTNPLDDRLSSWAREKRLALAQGGPPAAGAVGPSRRDLVEALSRRRGRLAVFAEPARRSPEEGKLREDLDVGAFARACVDADVTALVLPTDPRFGLDEGDWRDLLDARYPLPVLHHDLVLGPAQVTASRGLGADAVWLHLGVLDDAELRRCVEQAGHLGMSVVAEGASPEHFERAVRAGAKICCASAFDEMGAQDLDMALELLRALPSGVARVVRGPVSGEAGLAPLRGEVDGIWICGPASMPRDTLAYLGPLVAEAARE